MVLQKKNCLREREGKTRHPKIKVNRLGPKDIFLENKQTRISKKKKIKMGNYHN